MYLFVLQYIRHDNADNTNARKQIKSVFVMSVRLLYSIPNIQIYILVCVRCLRNESIQNKPLGVSKYLCEHNAMLCTCAPCSFGFCVTSSSYARCSRQVELFLFAGGARSIICSCISVKRYFLCLDSDKISHIHRQFACIVYRLPYRTMFV